MKNAIVLMFIALTLNGCAAFRPYKMPVEQGNIITPADVERIRIGMPEEEVTLIMGHPVLINTFTEDRMTYVYTFIPPYCPMSEKRVIIYLEHGRVSKIVK